MTSRVDELVEERDRAREECGVHKHFEAFASRERDMFLRKFIDCQKKLDAVAADLRLLLMQDAPPLQSDAHDAVLEVVQKHFSWKSP